MTTTERKRAPRKLGDLKDFPLQRQFFDDLSEHDLRALADDIERNGLRQRIEVLPPENKAGLPADTIISGHQRKRALELLGETETVVTLRYDLAEVDRATVERLFLEANQNRRHLDPLSKARVALRLHEIERQREPGKLRSMEQQDARDRVGAVTGMSGRNLQRYWNVLRAPHEVQEAFRAGKLSLVVAARCGCLDKRTQETIAKRLAAGKQPKDAVSEHLPSSNGRPHKTGDALASFVQSLRRALTDLAGREETVSATLVRQYLPDLKKGRQLIHAIIDQVEA